MSEQNVVGITGMERSGTSLIVRLASFSGLYLGSLDKLILETGYNPKGCWEHRNLLNISEEILGRYQGNTHNPPLFAAGWEMDPGLDDLYQRAEEIIQEDFSGQALWGWKDTRLCLTLPFWRRLMPKMRHVLCLRDPMDVAVSLVRNQWVPDLEHGLWLWEHYTNSALHATAGSPRLLIFYEDCMADWSKEYERLAQFLEISSEVSLELEDQVGTFLDTKLHHYRSSFLETLQNQEIPYSVKALYLILRQSVWLEQGDHPGREATDAISSLATSSLASQEPEGESSQRVTNHPLREQVWFGPVRSLFSNEWDELVELAPGIIGNGFYPREADGHHWMGKVGKIRISKELLKKPARISFNIGCAYDSSVYQKLPLIIEVNRDGEKLGELVFGMDAQTYQVDLRLSRQPGDYEFTLVSPEVFVPSPEGEVGDKRSLSVHLFDMKLVALNENNAIEKERLIVEWLPVALTEDVQGYGFYASEGAGLHWMSRVGKLRIPAHRLSGRVEISFQIICAHQLGVYEEIPFAVQVYVDEAHLGQVLFDTPGQVQEVRIRLEPQTADLDIRLESRNGFIPQLLGLGGDRRILSVQVANVQVYPVD